MCAREGRGQVGGNDMLTKAKIPVGSRTYSFACNQSECARRYGDD